jgi:maltose alpha-D-glucosyltransferase/alpha-amylase
MLGDALRLRLAYSLVLSLPGTPVLHYGDEIGMGEDLRLRDRAAVRTPMQWSPERNAGFSRADSLVRPVVSRGPFAYENVNVEEQQRDPDSLLRWMTGMIRLRKQCPEIGWGDWRIVPTGSRNVLAIAYTWRGNTIVTVHNLAQEAREAKLRLGGGTLTNLVDAEEIRATQGGVHRVALDGYAYRWLRLGATNQALAREIVD